MPARRATSPLDCATAEPGVRGPRSRRYRAPPSRAPSRRCAAPSARHIAEPDKTENLVRHASPLPVSASIPAFAADHIWRISVSLPDTGIVDLSFPAGERLDLDRICRGGADPFPKLAGAGGRQFLRRRTRGGPGGGPAAGVASRDVACRSGPDGRRAGTRPRGKPVRAMRRARAAARAHAFQENEWRAEEDRARFRAAWEDALHRGLDREEEGLRRRSGTGLHVAKPAPSGARSTCDGAAQ